jgi:transposase-like protein
MTRYSSLIADLESSTDSFNTVAKRHGFIPATAYNGISRVRPDLLTPRSERLGFARLVNPDSVSADVRDAAVARVLAGEPVKEVSAETGVPAPTLYKHAAARRETVKTPPPAVPKAQTPIAAVSASVAQAVASGHSKEDVLKAVLGAL